MHTRCACVCGDESSLEIQSWRCGNQVCCRFKNQSSFLIVICSMKFWYFHSFPNLCSPFVFINWLIKFWLIAQDSSRQIVSQSIEWALSQSNFSLSIGPNLFSANCLHTFLPIGRLISQNAVVRLSNQIDFESISMWIIWSGHHLNHSTPLRRSASLLPTSNPAHRSSWLIRLAFFHSLQSSCVINQVQSKSNQSAQEVCDTDVAPHQHTQTGVRCRLP